LRKRLENRLGILWKKSKTLENGHYSNITGKMFLAKAQRREENDFSAIAMEPLFSVKRFSASFFASWRLCAKIFMTPDNHAKVSKNGVF
jgi:hypothetical protein